MLTRRSFLASSFAAASSPGGAAPARPNVVVIVADDLGWGELTVQGFAKDIPTPHIDSIARNGVRFTNGYVSCPVCSPTRAGLITGRYQQRFGHEFNPGPEELATSNFGLPLSETTIANLLKKAGYDTGMVGKWHLGYKPEYHPLKRGFDEFFGFLGGAHPYLNPGERAAPILRGTEKVDEKEYLTDAFTREATAFVSKKRNNPFFLYLTYNAVHNPLEATEKRLSRFASISNTRRRTFAAMLSALDDGVGAVLNSLRASKALNNTLLFFISDNGGPTQQTTSINGPLRGYKGQTLEGGIRVPFLAQWPGRIAAGKVNETPAIALDILPTSLAAAGLAAPASLDGVNLLPALGAAPSALKERSLYWRFGEQGALRRGDWKIVRQADSAPWQLFNLASDIGESKNLASAETSRLQSLEQDWQAWNAQLAKPLWDRPNRQPAARKNARKNRK